MFGEKCSRCGNRVSKKHSFCASCGTNLKAINDNNNYGFLGKNDLDNLADSLPFGFKAMLKPLMKELNKQMAELDKEMRKEQEENLDNKKKVVKSFSIHIGAPGQKPIRINSSGNMNFGQVAPQNKDNPQQNLPKIHQDKLDKVKHYPRKEPATNVRRLADNVEYEISLPGVKDLSDINIASLEDSIEVKAIGKKEVFIKNIDVDLPLKQYAFESNKLILELGLK